LALTCEQRDLVSEAIVNGLNRAETAWVKVGRHFEKRAMDAATFEEHAESSVIPGHKLVTSDSPKVDEFIALVVDMRDSTGHLKTNLSLPLINDGFQRIYYETSALLPAISVAVSFEKGVVTEYLGDGALILFQVDKDNKGECIKSASRAARACVSEVRELINVQLKKRYDLPILNLGAGLAISNALVTLVGSSNNWQPKAIGECIWEASKLSGGTNTVHISQSLKSFWPKSEGGKMRFCQAVIRGVDGYRLQLQ
jgi:class 3 adenylate cyclase